MRSKYDEVIKMSIYEFLDLVKKEPMKWINYCEIIITKTGGVLVATPSHVERIHQYIYEKYGITKDELNNEMPYDVMPIGYLVDKYNLIAVWYSGYLWGSLNKFQKKVIRLLQENNLITSDDPYIMEATDYRETKYKR